MIKLLKGFLKILIFLSIIVIALIFGVVNFVDPNQFKPVVEKEVLDQTGHVLTVQGPISWRWWPMLSLELDQIALEALEPFKNPLFSAESISAEAEILPLLSGKIFLNLKIKGVDLRLERNAKGDTNWGTLKQRLLSSQNSPSSSSEANPFQFRLNGIEIKNGQVTLKDDKKNMRYTFANLNLSAGNLFKGILQNSNPISLSFDLEDEQAKLLGKLQLSSKWSLQQNLNQLDIQDITLKLAPSNGKSSVLKGNIEIKNLKDIPLIEGICETESIDPNAWLKSFNIDENAAIPSSMNIKFAFKYQDPQLEITCFNINAKENGNLEGSLSLNFQTILNLNGTFLGKQLKVGTLYIDEVKSAIVGKENVISLNPITLKIANIPQQATLQIDLQGTTPRFSFTGEGQDFEINQLLSFFDVKNKLAGKTHYTVKLNASGKNVNELRKSLIGHAEIEIASGKLYGINLVDLLKNAQASIHSLVDALINKQTFNVKNTLSTEYQRWKIDDSAHSQAFTPFDKVKASINIENELAKNSDLSITHPDYSVSGGGTVNLTNEAIQYHTSILLRKNPYPATDQVAHYLYETPLPATISGTLSNPVIRPDLDTYTNEALAYAQKNFVEKLINKTINKALERLLPKN